jgi:hypothetical protein
MQAHELYFSTSHDVTLSCQRRALLDSRQSKLPLWKRADDRFFWNKNLLTPLVRPFFNRVEERREEKQAVGLKVFCFCVSCGGADGGGGA